MGSKGSANRQRIVDAADRLFYSRGYNQTSFSDISDETGIPRGNFYYYFKTKEDILNAVVKSRVEVFSNLLKQCETGSDDPAQHLKALLNLPLQQEQDTLQYGCPIGSLSSELCKDEMHRVAPEKLTAVFDVMRNWCRDRFLALGYDAEESTNLAMDMLAQMQGVAILASTYNDGQYLRRGIQQSLAWLQKLIDQKLQQ